MATQAQIDSFHTFATQHVQSGHCDLTVAELFDLWESQSFSQDELAESVAAVKAALCDMEQGDEGRPFAEFADAIRKRASVDS